MDTLKAGCAKVCITPPVGTRMAGYAGRTDGCTGVHDDLFGRALVLDDGAAPVALLTLDLIGIDCVQVAQIRERVQAQTGIAPSHVMVCCSHTHSGPVMPSSDPRRDPLGEREVAPVPARVEVLVEALAGAVKQAWDARQDVRLRFISGVFAHWSQNRRRVAQGGLPIDPDVRGLVLTDAADAPVAVVVNYACHPTVMGGKNLRISADYPGAMVRFIEAACPGCAAMFVNGACANVNPNWFNLASNSFDTVARMGRALGGEVVRAMYTAIATGAPESDVALGADRAAEPLPLWPQPDGEAAGRILEAQRALLARAKAGEFPQNPFPFWHSMVVDENLSVSTAESYVAWAERLVRLAEAKVVVPAPDAEVQALRIGRGGLASLPGEVFMGLGGRIKAAFPNRPVMAAGYANGSVGYIPTREAFAEQGYEVTVAQRFRALPIAEDGGEILTERAIGLLRKLF